MSKQLPPAPTASAIGPCPTFIHRTPWHWKRTQGHRTIRPHPVMKPVKLFHLVGTGLSFVCCLVTRVSTGGFLLLLCFSGVV